MDFWLDPGLRPAERCFYGEKEKAERNFPYKSFLFSSMFPKKNRVSKKAFEVVLKKSRLVSSPNLTLRFTINQDSPPRISFVAPKAVVKKAVGRNQLRRRGYTILQKYINQLPTGFLGIFFFGKKSIGNFSGRKNKNYNPIQNLEYEIKNILDKIN
jgi:ribonuclease P protein component